MTLCEHAPHGRGYGEPPGLCLITPPPSLLSGLPNPRHTIHPPAQPTAHAWQVWYGVPAHASQAMEEAMRDALPHLFEASPSLLYQLVTHMSPTELQVCV